MTSTPLKQVLGPDLLRFNSGQAVHLATQWPMRRDEVRGHLLPLAYGCIPPAPAQTAAIQLHMAPARQFPGVKGVRLLTLRVEVVAKHAFLMQVFVPDGDTAMPVVLSGDGCWHNATDQVIAEVLRRGHIFAQFNRVEVAADPSPPSVGAQNTSCALAWWAWAYHRAVDALSSLAFVNPAAIAVVGHSRGGKAALLAGATDDRIALTCANNSGAGGAGCFRIQGEGAETLGDLLEKFPHWMNPALHAFVGRENELPFDQHFLKALIAPRALLTTEALDDHWANPVGTWQTHLAAAQVYELLSAKEKIACKFRSGGHEHNFEDWCAFLDFADLHLGRT
jgi:hypothetical protein